MAKKRDEKMTIEERYQILISARNFHYDNFSKWMTYFYVAIGAIFVGYCTVISSDKIKDVREKDLAFGLSALGFIISLLWYWSAKGYYYWNINFINLVNYYERDLLGFSKKERVYFVFANKNTQNNYLNPVSGANISTSKIAILFAFIIAAFWGSLLIHSLFEYYNYKSSLLKESCYSCLCVLVLSLILPYFFLRSKNDHFHDLELKFKKEE